MSLSRRDILKLALGSGIALALPGRARASGARVVVIGGGFGGATAAKYLRMWAPEIDVTLVERDRRFVSCPLSNRVLAGVADLDDLTRDYSTLASRWGVTVVHEEATRIDTDRRLVQLAGGASLPYDRLIISPGLDLLMDAVPGWETQAARENVLHAWKAGPQTDALRRQLESMSDGGVYAMTVPRSPYRCPPGPYERACQVAWYFKTHKPRSKVLILDANEKVQSKELLFLDAWKDMYPGIVEYRPNSTLTAIDARTRTARLEFEDVRADVLNVVPPQRAGRIAADAGLITTNDKWCAVDFLTFESMVRPNVHVLGDAVLAAPLMPKSGHMANQHAKVCAAAVAALLRGQAVNPAPMMTNTCYSFVSDTEVVHIASVHEYNNDKKTFTIVEGSGGLSSGPSAREGSYAESWGRNIWADMLA
ncbi:MAG: FAD-dependent oxidoreductase [Burkholderiales bacterium]|nr:FAD-dependent oxidoreductase [Burkholderiales bacterium]